MSKTSVKIDGASGEIEIKVGDDIKVELKSDKIKITGDVEINGDLVVSNGSNKTTISGNSIEGA
jgi:phage baseplate assembly protein gpV